MLKELLSYAVLVLGGGFGMAGIQALRGWWRSRQQGETEVVKARIAGEQTREHECWQRLERLEGRIEKQEEELRTLEREHYKLVGKQEYVESQNAALTEACNVLKRENDTLQSRLAQLNQLVPVS